MVKNSKNPENSQENSENSEINFNFGDINAGRFTPCYDFLFDFLEKNTINVTDFAIFQIIFKKAFLTEKGRDSFKMSNADISRLVGLSRKPIEKSLLTLHSLGLIKVIPAKNGLSTTVKIRLETLQKLGKNNHGQKEQGTTVEKDTVKEKEIPDHGQKDRGTLSFSTEHLLEKVLKVSSSYYTKFSDSKKRNLFNRDIKKLAIEGVNIDAIASFLDVEVYDFNHIRSFYGLIDKNRDRLLEIHLEKQKTEMEAAKRRQVYIENEQNAPDLTFKTPAAISEWKKPGNAFKGKPGAFMQKFDLDNYNAFDN